MDKFKKYAEILKNFSKDQGDFECKIKNRVPVSLPCVPDRDGNSANRKVIVLSFIASLL